jgi:hypothetical protein
MMHDGIAGMGSAPCSESVGNFPTGLAESMSHLHAGVHLPTGGASKLEIHYTPKHGSWLNMAEIELSVLARQCLDRRIPDQETLTEEVGAWEAERNAEESSIDWRFTSADARIKL